MAPKAHTGRKTLSLTEAVQFGISNNFIIQNNNTSKSIVKTALQYQKNGFFIPSVTLIGNYMFKDTMSQHKFSDGYFNDPIEPDPLFAPENNPTYKTNSYKEASIQLLIDDINLFNSFDDKRILDAFKRSSNTEMISLNNDSRLFFLELISTYYRAYTSEARLEDARRRYKIALSLYDLAKTIRNIKDKQDLDLDYFESSFLEAKGILVDSKIAHRENIRSLKSQIITDIDENTKLTSDFSVKTNDLNLQDLMKKARTAPNVQIAANNVEVARLELQQARIDYIPKLSLSVSGHTTGRRYNADGTYYNIRQYDQADPLGNQGNVNFTAAINLSIPIFSKDQGFFNTIEYKRRLLNHKSAKDFYRQTKRDLIDFVKQSYYSIKESEEALVFAKRRLKSDSKILSKMISKYTNNQVERDQLREALENSFNSMSTLLENKLNYLDLRRGVALELGDIRYLGLDLKDTVLKTILRQLRN